MVTASVDYHHRELGLKAELATCTQLTEAEAKGSMPKLSDGTQTQLLSCNRLT